MRLSTLLLCCLAALVLTAAPAAGAEPRDVIYVGNNWDGTSTVADAETFKPIARINIIPDKDERLAEIQSSPDRQAYFLAIREAVGEGNDQFVDDMYSSPDGRFLYVSRPSFADVIAMDLTTRKIVWRTPVEGYRSDHMGISPDGKRLLVSASTAKKVHEIDTATGKIVGGFPSGDQPHENNYSLDGKKVFHASIGSVFTPADQYAFDTTKGERVFLVVETGRTRSSSGWTWARSSPRPATRA
jgi:DNA-binding beta-propeller fold protein YncE